MGSVAIRSTFHTQRVDPERLWIGFTPKGWPSASRLTLDVAPAGGRRAGHGDGVPAVPSVSELRRVADVIGLPAVDPGHRAPRDAWLSAAAEAGVPAIAIVEPGEEPTAGLGVVDLFETLAEGTWRGFADCGSADVALWPLVGGWSDGSGLVAEGLDALRDAGFRTVVGLRAELEPTELRQLAERIRPELYERLFHAPPADRRAFARAAVAVGLEWSLDRPLPAGPSRLRRNRRLAGLLFRIGELSLHLGRPELEAQAFYRAARWVDDAPHDVRSIADGDNLDIVEPIEPPARDAIEAFYRDGRSDLLADLEAEYLADPAELESPSDRG